MKKIGIVGLGVMGRGIADNFLINKYPLSVWNRTMAVCKPFSDRGAKICSSPADVVKNADVIFEITANDESSRLVWEGKDGILTGATSEKILILSSTVSVGWTDELIEKCKTKKASFMDAAMTGGRIGAETGSLTLLCGAQKNIFDAMEETLSAISKKRILFGPEGQGMRFKLILNFLQAVHVVGFGQAIKIAKKHNMDLNKVADALVDRPGGVVTKIARDSYFTEPNPVTFYAEWIMKDLSYAKKLAGELEVGFLDEALRNYKKMLDLGQGKKDWTGINTLK